MGLMSKAKRKEFVGIRLVNEIAGMVPKDVYVGYQTALAKFKVDDDMTYRGLSLTQNGLVGAIFLEFLTWSEERQRAMLEVRLPQLERMSRGDKMIDVLGGGGNPPGRFSDLSDQRQDVTSPMLPAEGRGGTAEKTPPRSPRRKREV
jgi:hypothetical protein